MTTIVAATEMGMLDDAERLRIISNNLANVGTVGFKRQLGVSPSFDQQLLQSTGGAQASGNRRLRHAGCGPMSIGCTCPSGWVLPSGCATPHCNFSDCP